MTKRQLAPAKLQDGAIALLQELSELFDDLFVPSTREAKRIAQAVRYARHLIEPTASIIRVCPEVAAKNLFDVEKGKAALEYSQVVDQILLRMELLTKQLHHWRNRRLATAGLETFVAFAFMKSWIKTPAGLEVRHHFKRMEEGLRRANARRWRPKKKKKV